MKPFLKWVGGKTQIIDKITNMLPDKIENYYEPFLGGGSVLLSVLSLREEKRIEIKGEIYASDINPVIIAIYKHIQNNPLDFIREVKKLISEFKSCKSEEIKRKPQNISEAKTSKESYYYWIRNNFNNLKDKTSLKASAMMLFMNKTCWRGVYRESKNGFNVPYGNYNNPEIINEEHILKISQIIKNVHFSTSSFEYVFDKIEDGDFVYLDPPYYPLKNTSFTSYVNGGFTINDHDTLFLLCKGCDGLFLLSNSNVIKEEFKEFNIQTIKCRRSINSKNPEEKVDEVIISNYQR